MQPNNLLPTLSARLVSKYALPDILLKVANHIFKLVEQLLMGAAWVPPSLPLLPGLNCQFIPSNALLLPAPAAATVSSNLSQLARSARATRYNLVTMRFFLLQRTTLL